jgi:integrase
MIDDPEMPAETGDATRLGLPDAAGGSATLDALVDDARDYARGAVAPNTLRAYARDWAHFESWCRRHGADVMPPSPELIGLYVTDCAKPTRRRDGLSVATIERRLSGLAWGYAQRGQAFDRQDRHIATVLAGVRRKHGRPPKGKEAVSVDDIRAMLASLPKDLRGLRDRAMLLVGFAGGLRRSEITGLDRGRDESVDGLGWVEIEDAGMLARLRGKTGWREVEIGRGAHADTCPIAALERWLETARIAHGPLFRRVSREGTVALDSRLSPQHMALLVKRTVEKAGIRGDLPERARLALFSGHSLRAGLASHAEVDERHVQKQLGHASAEMTRRYQRRRDRYRVNISKALGL